MYAVFKKIVFLRLVVGIEQRCPAKEKPKKRRSFLGGEKKSRNIIWQIG